MFMQRNSALLRSVVESPEPPYNPYWSTAIEPQKRPKITKEAKDLVNISENCPLATDKAPNPICSRWNLTIN